MAPEQLYATTAKFGDIRGAGIDEVTDEAVIAEGDHLNLGDATRARLAEGDGATSF